VTYYDVYYINDLSTEVSPYYTTYKSTYTNLGGKNIEYGTSVGNRFKYWLNTEDVSANLYKANDDSTKADTDPVNTDTYAQIIPKTYSKDNLAASPTATSLKKVRSFLAMAEE
jgi:hypothetical protein